MRWTISRQRRSRRPRRLPSFLVRSFGLSVLQASLFYGGLWGLSSDKSFTGWPSAKDPYASLMTWGSTPLLVLTHLKAAK